MISSSLSGHVGHLFSDKVLKWNPWDNATLAETGDLLETLLPSELGSFFMVYIELGA